MLSKKHTSWKKNRKLGDVYGGRRFPKLTDKIFNQLHSLVPLLPGEETPVFIVDNPSRDFYFPVSVEDIKYVLKLLPVDHTEHLTHIWLQRVKLSDYLKNNTFQGCCICGSGVVLIVLHPFPKDHKMRLGSDKPTQKTLNYYKSYAPILDHDGWHLLWTKEEIRRYYLESLLLHEIGHSIDFLYKKYWSKAFVNRSEKHADNYAAVWGNKLRQTITDFQFNIC
jgi:hypothetical protein